MQLHGLTAAVAATMLAYSGAAAAASHDAAFLTAGEIAEAPAGFVAMCRADPAACSISAPAAAPPQAPEPALPTYFTTASIILPSAALLPAPVTAEPAPAPTVDEMSADAASDIERAVIDINAAVNARVVQQSDEKSYGVGELWRAAGREPGAVGDCEDIALEKRAELIAAGVPADRLRLAVVFRSGVGLHTVLLARLASGDVVLDSRTPRVLDWTQARYSWLRVQSATNPMEWRRIARS